MTTDLALSTDISPAQFDQQIVAARLKARSLAALVEQAGLAVQIGSSKHLRVEAWETIGRAYGLTTGTGDTVILESGVKATAFVYDGMGTIVGRADGYCFREEEQWAEKPLAQLAGMAQTRAVSRALRQILAWVVVLAGYSATPAEEMEATRKGQDQGYGICPIHNVAWFQRGKMRRPAHPPIVQGEEWCNKPAGNEQPTEEDLGFGSEGRVVEPPPQKATDGASSPAPRKPFPIWDKKAQTDWQYITGVAKDLYQKDQQAFRQMLGMSWAEWVKKHETQEAAIQAALLRLGES